MGPAITHDPIEGQSADALPSRQGVRPVTEARAAALCGGSVVVIQQPTQPRTTHNRPVTASRPLGGEEQSIAHALMVAFVIIVLDNS